MRSQNEIRTDVEQFGSLARVDENDVRIEFIAGLNHKLQSKIPFICSLWNRNYRHQHRLRHRIVFK